MVCLDEEAWQDIVSVQVWHELRNILMVMILLMLYLVLWVPYIVMAKGDQVAIKYLAYWFSIILLVYWDIVDTSTQKCIVKRLGLHVIDKNVGILGA